MESSSLPSESTSESDQAAAVEPPPRSCPGEPGGAPRVAVSTRAAVMKCPFCGFLEDRVLDSRVIRDGEAIKRRRECLQCSRRYTTYESIEERRLLVVKKDGRREPFDRGKILRGLTMACQKRSISAETLERIVDDLERELYDRGEPEVPAHVIGERVIQALRHLDQVAYVRFASVYRDFQDLGEFREFLDELRREGRRKRAVAGARRNGVE